MAAKDPLIHIGYHETGSAWLKSANLHQGLGCETIQHPNLLSWSSLRLKRRMSLEIKQLRSTHFMCRQVMGKTLSDMAPIPGLKTDPTLRSGAR